MQRTFWLCAVALAALTPSMGSAQTPVKADTAAVTSAGVSYTIPQSWSSKSLPSHIEVTPPEGDLVIAIVEVGAAADATVAAARAWAAFRPNAGRVLKLATARAPKEGWDERQVIDYETSPNEKAAVFAIALRQATNWTVAIIDGSEATLEKRGAAAQLVTGSLRPKGFARENFAGRKALPLDSNRIALIKSFVADSIKELGVPGASIALIDGGKVVYEGGFGVRELGKPDLVDADTLFMIASNTKGMSTLLLSTLVDEGKVDWEQPVTQVYPSFRLGSAETTAKVLVKHLVCACTGLPRKDMEWLFNTSATTPASDTFVQLAATEPTSGFGELFQYNNLMASAAGYVAGALAYPGREVGAAYDEAMRTRVFEPLGMTATTFDFARALAGNHASPHADGIVGTPTVANQDLNTTVAPFRPAGGAWSSARDMIRYVGNELAQGQLPGGKRMVSAKNLLARRTPYVPTGEDNFYGMGLSGNTMWGVPIINHGGSMGGYKSDIVFLPEAGVGAVILTNADNGQALLRPFMRRLVEVLYDGKPEAARDVAASAARIKAEVGKLRADITVPPAPALVAALAPRYESPELGPLIVRRDGDSAVFRFRSWDTRVGTRTNPDGTTSFVSIDPTIEGVPVVVGSKDGKRTLIVRDSQHEYVFVEAN